MDIVLILTITNGAEKSTSCAATGKLSVTKNKSCISKLLNEWGCGPLAKDDFVHEVCRYGGAELHSVSAFIGGCAAQEAIKLITKQYKPLNNMLLYDAMTSSTETFVF